MAEVFEFPGAKRGPPVNEDERRIADAGALARAKKAQAVYEAAAVASAASPDDENLSNIMGDLCSAETDAYDELENTPCASDEEFLEKLKYMIAHEVHIFGSPFESRAEFMPVARAVALHFGAGTAA